MHSATYAAIQTELSAINAYTALVYDENEIARNEPPPRMIVIPSDDAFGPPLTVGGNPKCIASVWEASTLIIRGATKDHIQGMRDQFVIALRRALKKSAPNTVHAGQMRLSKGVWQRAQFIATQGWEYTLTWAVIVAIVDRKWALDGDDRPVPPDASTYQDVLTYPIVPGDQMTTDANVGVRDGATDNPTVIINPE